MPTSDPERIQRIEFHLGPFAALHCPFCGQLVQPGPDADDRELRPCAHTLFIATDEGFEFRSLCFDAVMGIAGIDNEDLDLQDGNIDTWTDTYPEPLAVKFAFYNPSPSFFGAYVAFHSFSSEVDLE